MLSVSARPARGCCGSPRSTASTAFASCARRRRRLAPLRRRRRPHRHRWVARATITIAGCARGSCSAATGCARELRVALACPAAGGTRSRRHDSRSPGRGEGGRRTQFAPTAPRPSAAELRARPAAVPARLPALRPVRAAGRSASGLSSRASRPRPRPGPGRERGRAAGARPPGGGRPGGGGADRSLSPYGPMFALARRLAAGAPRAPTTSPNGSGDYLLAQLPLRRTRPAGALPAGGVPVRAASRLLPAVLGRDDADAAHGRDPGPRRLGLPAGACSTPARAPGRSARSTPTPGWKSSSPGIGWVSFDPTPPTAAGASLEETTALSRTAVFGGGSVKHAHRDLTGRAARHVRRAGGGGFVARPRAPLGGAVLVAAGGFAWSGRASAGDGRARAMRTRRSQSCGGRWRSSGMPSPA